MLPAKVATSSKVIRWHLALVQYKSSLNQSLHSGRKSTRGFSMSFVAVGSLAIVLSTHSLGTYSKYWANTSYSNDFHYWDFSFLKNKLSLLVLFSAHIQSLVHCLSHFNMLYHNQVTYGSNFGCREERSASSCISGMWNKTTQRRKTQGRKDLGIMIWSLSVRDSI